MFQLQLPGNFQHEYAPMGEPFRISAVSKTRPRNRRGGSSYLWKAPTAYRIPLLLFGSMRTSIHNTLRQDYDQAGLYLSVQSLERTQRIFAGLVLLNGQSHFFLARAAHRRLWPTDSRDATVEYYVSSGGKLRVRFTMEGQTPLDVEILCLADFDQEFECWAGPFVANPFPLVTQQHLAVVFRCLSVIS